MQLGTHTRHDRRRRRTTHPYFEISEAQRLRHVYVLGKTGVGKSTALINWLTQDIHAGRGCLFIDPHGDDAETLLTLIPPYRRRDVIYFNPAEFPIAFNVFDRVPKERHAFVASSVVDAFKSVWHMDYAPNVEMFVYAACAALLETPGATLLGLNYILTSPRYRKRVENRITDPVIRDFWRTTFDKHMTDREQRDRTLSTINKIITLIADPAIRHCIGQPKAVFDFAEVIAGRKIFIASLPQGDLGIEKSSLIGSFLLANFHAAALQRGDDRSVFPVVIDESHRFGGKTLAEALTGLRKFGISIVLSNQYLAQHSPEMQAAIFGSVGTIVCFQVGPADAEALASQFRNTKPDELMNLPAHRAMVRSGDTTIELAMPPVTAKTYPSAPRRIRANCRSTYSAPRETVERDIAAFIDATTSKPRPRVGKRPIQDMSGGEAWG
jgi:hypothetical protein